MTICHSRTRDLPLMSDGRTLVVAVGVAGVVRGEMVKEGARWSTSGSPAPTPACSATSPEIAERAALLTPVPGGVGPMTIAMLLRSTVRAVRYREGQVAHPGV